MSGTGGEPHPDTNEDPIIKRSDGGRGPRNDPYATPIAMLGTGGEPRPNMSKVEGSII